MKRIKHIANRKKPLFNLVLCEGCKAFKPLKHFKGKERAKALHELMYPLC